MDAGVTHNLINKDMVGELLRHFLGFGLSLLFLTFFGDGLCCGVGIFLFWRRALEDIKSNALSLDQSLVNDVLVFSSCMLEENMRLGFIIFVSFIVIGIFYLFLWSLELTNIDGSRISKLLKVGGETLEHVLQIVLLFNGGSKLVNLILTFGRTSFFSLAFFFFFVKSFLITFLVAFHFLLIFFFVFSRALNLSVVQQPFGKEIDGVLRIGPVHDGHAL